MNEIKLDAKEILEFEGRLTLLNVKIHNPTLQTQLPKSLSLSKELLDNNSDAVLTNSVKNAAVSYVPATITEKIASLGSKAKSDIFKITGYSKLVNNTTMTEVEKIVEAANTAIQKELNLFFDNRTVINKEFLGVVESNAAKISNDAEKKSFKKSFEEFISLGDDDIKSRYHVSLRGTLISIISNEDGKNSNVDALMNTTTQERLAICVKDVLTPIENVIKLGLARLNESSPLTEHWKEKFKKELEILVKSSEFINLDVLKKIAENASFVLEGSFVDSHCTLQLLDENIKNLKSFLDDTFLID